MLRMVELPKLKEKDGSATEQLYKLFSDTQGIISEIEKTEGVVLAKTRKEARAMIDYEALLEEAEARASVKSTIRAYCKLRQDPSVARASVLEEYPDTDIKALDSVIAEVYVCRELDCRRCLKGSTAFLWYDTE